MKYLDTPRARLQPNGNMPQTDAACPFLRKPLELFLKVLLVFISSFVARAAGGATALKTFDVLMAILDKDCLGAGKYAAAFTKLRLPGGSRVAVYGTHLDYRTPAFATAVFAGMKRGRAELRKGLPCELEHAGAFSYEHMVHNKRIVLCTSRRGKCMVAVYGKCMVAVYGMHLAA